MKRIFSLLFILTCVFSCNKNMSKKNLTQEEIEAKHHIEIHKEMDKISLEFEKFNVQLSDLYNESERNPKLVLSKADSLISSIKKRKDPIKGLHYLKAEIFYKLGNYNSSIEELNKSKYSFITGDLAAGLAANNVKLKKYDEAKKLVDSIGKAYYIYDYCLANYYESIGNRDEALKIYTTIKNDKTIKHYAYYSWSVKRFEELRKDNPVLLNEIHFPTRNPKFEIADSDDYNRTKIFKMIFEIPEAKDKSVWIFESPQENDKDYYWIKVGEGDIGLSEKKFKTDYNFFIYPKNFEIKYYNQKENKLISIEEWRRNK